MTPPLGLARGLVELNPYDVRWPHDFEAAAIDLRRALGHALERLERYGSTAVPGLDAKPIIDLLGGVPSLALSPASFRALERIGYAYRPLDTVAGRLFFAKGPASCRTHNLSICIADSDVWHDRIAFRDALRADFRLAQAYADLKNQLARRHSADRRAYTQAKEIFIRSVLTTLPVRPR